MKTRKTLISHHGIIEDGAFVAILLLVCHMIAVCQCQRPFTNGSQSQTLHQQQQNADVKHQTDVYLYDNDVVRIFDPNLMTTTNGDGSGGSATSGSSGSGTGETSRSPQRTHNTGKLLGKSVVGGDRSKFSDGRGLFGFGINYAAVPPSQSGAGGGYNDTQQRDTFRELRKNLKDPRRQWDRQGDDPEQERNHMDVLKKRISTVSKNPFYLRPLYIRFYVIFCSRFSSQIQTGFHISLSLVEYRI